MKSNQPQKGGCLSQLAVALVAVVLIGALVLGGIAFFLNRSLAKYTTTEPQPPSGFTAEEAEAQYRNLAPRIEKLLADQADGGREGTDVPDASGLQAQESDSTESANSGGGLEMAAPPMIRLSADDLNALAFKHMKHLPENTHITFSISSDRLIAHASVPLKGVPLLGGRHFVGTVELGEAPPGYPLPLYLEAVTAAGQPVPGFVLSHFQDPAEARSFLQSNGLGDGLGDIRSIKIESGELVVRLNTR